jgi:serine/threonine protein kinase
LLLQHLPFLSTAAMLEGVFLLLLQDLIQKLLERKPAKRLGMLSGKAQDVKRHRWFEGMDWAALEARRSAPPRRPKVGSHNMLTWTVTACWTFLLIGRCSGVVATVRDCRLLCQ